MLTGWKTIIGVVLGVVSYFLGAFEVVIEKYATTGEAVGAFLALFGLGDKGNRILKALKVK